MSDKKYPIAEIFTSPQGEGLYTGTLMTFVRTGGCSVGKRFPKDRYELGTNKLPIYTEQCTTYDGRKFECDTDFRTKELLTAEEILRRVPENVYHLCITGGEPLIHDLTALLDAWYIRIYERRRNNMLPMDPTIHIETSGTEMINPNIFLKPYEHELWVTISPKFNVKPEMLKICDEIKLLVDENYSENEAWKVLQHVKEDAIVWIQPINGEHDINHENVRRCIELQKKYSKFRISTQMHKNWKVR